MGMWKGIDRKCFCQPKPRPGSEMTFKIKRGLLNCSSYNFSLLLGDCITFAAGMRKGNLF
jgi:hypothetical protein